MDDDVDLNADYEFYQFTHKGLIIPWITRWTSEVRTQPVEAVRVGSDVMVGFRGERPEDHLDGVLFVREGDSRGVGEPQWRSVHTHRQRRAQLEGRCQVCGVVIEDRVIPWLIPTGLATRSRGNLLTDVAPCCEDCLPIALRYCPFMSTHEVQRFDVRGYRPWGVHGDIIDVAEAGMVQYRGEIPFASSQIDSILARQVIVELWDYRRRNRS